MGPGTRARDDDAATALGAKLAQWRSSALGSADVVVFTDATTPTPAVASDGREARARVFRAMARKRRSRSRVASAVALLALALLAAWYRVRTHDGVDGVRTVASSSTTTIDRLVDDDGVDAPLVATSAAGERPLPASPHRRRLPPPDPLDAFPRGATLTVTFATSELGDLLHNWVHHVRRARLPQVHVIALDRETASWCAENDVPHEDASALVDKTNLGTGVRGFRENVVSFNVIGLAKIRALARLLDRGFHIVVSDVDVVWLSDPSEYLVSGQAALADVVVSSDCIFGFEPDREPVDAFGQATNPVGAEFNTGVLALRPTPRTRRIVERWEAALVASEDPRMNDQTHFNRVIGWGGAGKRPTATFADSATDDDDESTSDASTSSTSSASSAKGKTPSLFRTFPDDRAFPEAWRRGLRPRLYECGSARVRVALLPTGLFPNGHAHYVSRLSARTGVTPTAVHNTYQYSGAPGKVWRFREEALWALDGAEWYGEGGRGTEGGGRGTGEGGGVPKEWGGVPKEGSSGRTPRPRARIVSCRFGTRFLSVCWTPRIRSPRPRVSRRRRTSSSCGGRWTGFATGWRSRNTPVARSSCLRCCARATGGFTSSPTARTVTPRCRFSARSTTSSSSSSSRSWNLPFESEPSSIIAPRFSPPKTRDETRIRIRRTRPSRRSDPSPCSRSPRGRRTTSERDGRPRRRARRRFPDTVPRWTRRRRRRRRTCSRVAATRRRATRRHRSRSDRGVGRRRGRRAVTRG